MALQMKWYDAAIQCHLTDLVYIDQNPSKTIPVPKVSSFLSRMYTQACLGAALFHFSGHLLSVVAAKFTSPIYRLAVGYLIQDVNKIFFEMALPYVNRFDIFNNERFFNTSQLEEHNLYLNQAIRKRFELKNSQSKETFSVSKMLGPEKLSELFEKDYPGVSLDFLHEEDKLPVEQDKMNAFLQRQVSRWALFKVNEEIRAAKTANIFENIQSLHLSNAYVVAGFVTLIALSSLFISAQLYNRKALLKLPKTIFIRLPAYIASLDLIHRIYLFSVNFVRAKTGLDQLMQLRDCEKKIESHQEQVNQWVSRFQHYKEQLATGTVEANLEEAIQMKTALGVAEAQFSTFKASLGFLSSPFFTLSPAHSFLKECLATYTL